MEVARQLLLGGADIEEQGGGFYPSTPLQIALQQDKVEIVKLLLEHGADVSVIDVGDGGSTLHLAASKWRATLRGHEAVALLIQHGADVSSKNESGWTALHRAAHHGDVEIVRVLLQYGANVLAETNSGETAEYWATLKAHHQVVAMLQAEAVTRAKCVAFAMSHQQRLGAGSQVARFDPELLRMVLAYVE